MKVLDLRKHVFFSFLLMMCFSCIALQACIDRIESSKGLACKTSSDCWDKLPCVDKFCGGRGKEGPIAEPRPDEPAKAEKNITKEPIAKPEPKSEPKGGKNDGPSPKETAAESVAEVDGGTPVDKNTGPEKGVDKVPDAGGQCKGKLDQFGLCKQDSDCCPGQKCSEQQTPAGKLKLCGPCKTDTDCPQKTKCCFQVICAARCG